MSKVQDTSHRRIGVASGQERPRDSASAQFPTFGVILPPWFWERYWQGYLCFLGYMSLSGSLIGIKRMHDGMPSSEVQSPAIWLNGAAFLLLYFGPIFQDIVLSTPRPHRWLPYLTIACGLIMPIDLCFRYT
jgi:hypothetical protein